MVRALYSQSACPTFSAHPLFCRVGPAASHSHAVCLWRKAV